LIGLNSTGGVQIGNFIFSDFGFAFASGSPTNPAPTASQIGVTQTPGSNVGLTFNSFWQSIPVAGDQDGNIRYSVTATGNNAIDQVNLAFNGAAPVPGPGTQAFVTETVSTLVSGGPGSTIGQLTTVNSIATGSTTTNNASLTLSPTRNAIFVSKDVQVNSGASGIATISWVDNTYHSTPVPEPASLGLGLMGVGLLARRRRLL
jgi:MYXO-CTERM domain-containing protein